jgi:hypothetical protein
VAGAVHHRVVERLDAEPVAGGKQHAVALVPDRERELAAQLMQALRADVLVGAAVSLSDRVRKRCLGFRPRRIASKS